MASHSEAVKTRWTIADYMALDEPDGPHFELSDGELLMSPSATLKHHDIRHRMEQAIREFLASSDLGVVTSEVDFKLGEATIRRPDVAFLRRERFQPEYAEMVPIPVAPDLAVEIVSTHDRPGALRKTVRDYLAGGTQSVWLLYPQSRTAHRYAPGEDAPEIRSAEAGQSFEVPGLLPGFSLPLSDILPAE